MSFSSSALRPPRSLKSLWPVLLLLLLPLLYCVIFDAMRNYFA
jgi:hypothetical protein